MFVQPENFRSRTHSESSLSSTAKVSKSIVVRICLNGQAELSFRQFPKFDSFRDNFLEDVQDICWDVLSDCPGTFRLSRDIFFDCPGTVPGHRFGHATPTLQHAGMFSGVFIHQDTIRCCRFTCAASEGACCRSLPGASECKLSQVHPKLSFINMQGCFANAYFPTSEGSDVKVCCGLLEHSAFT